MTRKEEILNRAIELVDKKYMDVGIKTTHEASVAACQEIAEWADENPNERMIAKYLYEKKGYPIDLNGNLPSFEEIMKDVIEAKVLPTNYEETEFCLDDYDEVEWVTDKVNKGELKLGDKVKLIIIKE